MPLESKVVPDASDMLNTPNVPYPYTYGVYRMKISNLYWQLFNMTDVVKLTYIIRLEET